MLTSYSREVPSVVTSASHEAVVSVGCLRDVRPIQSTQSALLIEGASMHHGSSRIQLYRATSWTVGSGTLSTCLRVEELCRLLGLDRSHHSHPTVFAPVVESFRWQAWRHFVHECLCRTSDRS